MLDVMYIVNLYFGKMLRKTVTAMLDDRDILKTADGQRKGATEPDQPGGFGHGEKRRPGQSESPVEGSKTGDCQEGGGGQMGEEERSIIGPTANSSNQVFRTQNPQTVTNFVESR
jgi:hypothetical protein